MQVRGCQGCPWSFRFSPRVRARFVEATYPCRRCSHLLLWREESHERLRRGHRSRMVRAAQDRIRGPRRQLLATEPANPSPSRGRYSLLLQTAGTAPRDRVLRLLLWLLHPARLARLGDLWSGQWCRQPRGTPRSACCHPKAGSHRGRRCRPDRLLPDCGGAFLSASSLGNASHGLESAHTDRSPLRLDAGKESASGWSVRSASSIENATPRSFASPRSATAAPYFTAPGWAKAFFASWCSMPTGGLAP